MSSSSYNPQEVEFRANRAISAQFGKPVAAGCGSIATDGTDKILALTAGAVYALQAITADVYISIGAAADTAGTGTVATSAANRLRLRFTNTVPTFLTAGPGGSVLHVTQVSGVGALEYAQMDDVG